MTTSPSTWLRIPRIRRALALSAVVLATGGLVLARSSASAFPGDFHHGPGLTAGKNSTAFSGPGAHGMVSLSHADILAGSSNAVFADVRIIADASENARVRAPISMAVVLDTSGSMSGEKIEEAKRSVLRLVSEMSDKDEITVVRYSDTSEIVQPLARVGEVRATLASKIRALDAGGGTNIPAGLSRGLREIGEAGRGRVRRIVLVSDGLDATRAQAENLARSSFSSGVTVSSLGIGLDFDESYMGSVAQSGHGNFAFVKDGASLASFLHRELEETSGTTIENARVRLELPSGVRFVSATGADASVNDGTVELSMGSLFAGDERRVVVELSATSESAPLDIATHASWSRVGGGQASIDAPRLRLVPVTSLATVEANRDGAVLASATSVIVSKRQLEAASAYAAGDVRRAETITAANEKALASAIAAAPPPAAAALETQKSAYAAARDGFAKVRPDSEEGKAAAKAGVAKDMGNLQRRAF
jgi:Ca-activated chloride channel family protein